MSLRVVPVELSEANVLVGQWHRHHQPSQGHRFSLGVVDEHGEWHGACIIGRPVARLAGSPRAVLEVVRLVTDGTRNACSILYAAAARAGQAMGYERIQTYILDSETGASLKASGLDLRGRCRWRSVEAHRRQAPAHRPADRGQEPLGQAPERHAARRRKAAADCGDDTA